MRFCIFGYNNQLMAYYSYAILCACELPMLSFIHAFFAYPVKNVFIEVPGMAVGMGWAAGGELLADLFVGWTPYTAIPILTNACGGLFVGLVVKHAGGVRKGFTTILGILITAFAKLFFFGDALSKQTLIALPLVTVACWMHIKFRTPPTKTAEEAKKKN